jgi:hypothetical protein
VALVDRSGVGEDAEMELAEVRGQIRAQRRIALMSTVAWLPIGILTALIIVAVVTLVVGLF